VARPRERGVPAGFAACPRHHPHQRPRLDVDC